MVWDRIIWGNSIQRWVVSLIIIIVSLLVGRVAMPPLRPVRKA